MSRVLFSDSVMFILHVEYGVALCFLTPGNALTILYSVIRDPSPLCSDLHRGLGEAAEEGEPVPECLLGADAAASTAVEVHPCPMAEGAPQLMGHIRHLCKEACPTVLVVTLLFTLCTLALVILKLLTQIGGKIVI